VAVAARGATGLGVLTVVAGVIVAGAAAALLALLLVSTLGLTTVVVDS